MHHVPPGARTSARPKPTARAFGAAGRAALAGDPLAELESAAGALGGKVQRTLADGLEALLRSLQRRNRRRTFGVCRTCRFFRAGDAAHEPGGPPPPRCGLTLEPLSDADSTLVCREHEPKAA